MSNITNFGNNNAQFGQKLDDQIKNMSSELTGFEEQSSNIIDNKASETQKILQDKNAKYRESAVQDKQEIDNVSAEFRTGAAKNRADAEKLLANRQKAANFESNIAAATANQGQKLTEGQLSSISKDIQNQFQDSINNAQADLINFNMALDDKLLNLGFTAVDKKRIIDEFTKSMDDEEAAAMVDAIAEKANNKLEFMNSLKEVVLGVRQKHLEEAMNRSLRENRIQETEEAFNAMNPEQRRSYVMDLFGPTWNVLSRGQQEELVRKAMDGSISFAEINNLIQNYKDQAEQNKAIQQNAVGHESLAPGLLDETGINTMPVQTFTQGNEFTPQQNTPTERTPAQNTISLIGSSNLTTTQKNSLISHIRNNPNISASDLKRIEDTVRAQSQARTQTPSSGQTPRQAPSAPQAPQQQAGYTVGGVTYKSQSAYNEMVNWMRTNQTRLRELQQTNPAGFKQMQDAIRKKYIL